MGDKVVNRKAPREHMGRPILEDEPIQASSDEVKTSVTLSDEVAPMFTRFCSQASLKPSAAAAYAISEYLRLRDMIENGRLIHVLPNANA